MTTSLLPRLVAKLQHMRWCQSCAEGSWEDCDEGRDAIAVLAEAEAALQATSEFDDFDRLVAELESRPESAAKLAEARERLRMTRVAQGQGDGGDFVMVPRAIPERYRGEMLGLFAEFIGKLTGLTPPNEATVFPPEWNGHLDRLVRDSYAAMIAAAPQPAGERAQD